MKIFRLIMIVALACYLPLTVNAQPGDSLQVSPFTPRVNVKMSALAAIGIVNPAVEFRLDKKWSMQL